MFGFIVGTLSLIGLVKVARWGRGGRGWGGHRRWMLRRLFERLDTTPGQEKVVAEAFDDLQRKGWQAREAMWSSRAAYARAMRGDQLDQSALQAAFESQQLALDELKTALREGLARTHEALSPAQRAALADVMEFGPRAFAHHHHRHGHWHRPMGSQSVSL
jgi:Spy/CpxP family protein refolding chaperone